MNQHARTASGPDLSAPAKASPAVRSKTSKAQTDHKPNPAADSLPPSTVDGSSHPLNSVLKFFASLRLTVVCLTLGMILVFWGTLAQVDLGLFKAQNEFFRSFWIYWGPAKAGWKIPIFPGGYLVGGVLLLNLVAAHFSRFHLARNKVGIWMVHVGLILLLLGQLLTDVLSRETILHLREGEAKNYTESTRETELAIIETTDSKVDAVVAVAQGSLIEGNEIRAGDLPFTVRVKKFFPNSRVENRPDGSTASAAATQGVGPNAIVTGVPRVTDMEHRDVPAAVVELIPKAGGSLGTWLVSEFVEQPQPVTVGNRSYNLVYRLRRFYKPFSIQLLKFQHDVYPGTEIPKNFSSRVAVHHPAAGENREVDIYMNNPLRYAGETYYQADWDKDDHGTILQVVHNPSWLTPYFSCVLVGLGLVVQFAIHLLGFTSKRRTT
jgi:hypothetical protein